MDNKDIISKSKFAKCGDHYHGWVVRCVCVYTWGHKQWPTKVIVLQEAQVADIFPHGDLLYSALVQGELLSNIYVTIWRRKQTKVLEMSQTVAYDVIIKPPCQPITETQYTCIVNKWINKYCN